jgi:hypothetical protein
LNRTSRTPLITTTTTISRPAPTPTGTEMAFLPPPPPPSLVHTRNSDAGTLTTSTTTMMTATATNHPCTHQISKTNTKKKKIFSHQPQNVYSVQTTPSAPPPHQHTHPSVSHHSNRLYLHAQYISRHRVLHHHHHHHHVYHRPAAHPVHRPRSSRHPPLSPHHHHRQVTTATHPQAMKDKQLVRNMYLIVHITRL